MERRVFLEMSPVASERALTAEELAEVRRRASRTWQWFAVRFAIGFLVVASVFSFSFVDNPWVKGIAYTVGNLLAVAGVFGAYMLWRAYREKELLASVDEDTVLYRFTTNGYWKSYNLPTFLSPPPELEVIYPQCLAIRSGGSLWRVFRPVPLVIIEDLPQATIGTNSRELTDLEQIEIDKHLIRRKKSLAWNLVFLPIAIAFCIWEYSRYEGGWPTLTMLVFPLAAIMGVGWIRFDSKRLAWLRKVRAAGHIEIEWANEVSTEWLELGELEWREGGEPARWRKHSGSGFSNNPS